MLDYFYGLTLVRLQRNAEAVTVLESAIRLDPNAPEPYYELGRAYFAMGRMDWARAEFERVIQLDPQHANAHYQLSRIYAKLGDTKKAREMAEETRRLKQAQLDEAIDIQRTRLDRFQPVQAH
jgi:tetratricopeptide (TPR) repeat protein